MKLKPCIFNSGLRLAACTLPTFLGAPCCPCTPIPRGNVLWGRMRAIPLSPCPLLRAAWNSPTLSDALINHGANQHFSNRAGELIMNRFMSNYSISASLPCSPTPQLPSPTPASPDRARVGERLPRASLRSSGEG